MRSKLLILTFLFLFFGASPVFADSVVINEIMAKPTDSDNEWIELYNNSPSDINITQWTITELTSSGNINSHPFPSIDLPSNSSCFFEFSNPILNNDGDTVSLNNSSGTQIDSYTYTSIASNISGKTFSRIPDGGNWQTNLTDPTKSNTNCNNLSLSPTPTPSQTPSSTPQASSIFTSTPSQTQINSDQSISISVNLTLPNNKNSVYYLSGAFKKIDGTRYFGLTKINSAWVKYDSEDYLNQYKITTDENGNWTGNFEVKPDVSDTDYKGSGDYIFKVAKYTLSGSSNWSNNETIIKINDVTTPSNSPSPQATSKPSPSPSSLPTKSKAPSPRPTSPLKNSYQNASVAGESISSPSASPEITVEVKNQKQINPLVWIGLFFIFVGGGIIGYIYLKKNRR